MKLHITFGLRYRHEPHPTFPQADPDGWVTVEASDLETAREIAFSAIGDAWAFSYPEDRFKTIRHMYTRGEIAVLTSGDTHCQCGHVRADHEHHAGTAPDLCKWLDCPCLEFQLATLAPVKVEAV